MMISSGVDGNNYLHRAFSIKGAHDPERETFRTFLSLVCKDLLRVRAQQFVIAFDGAEVFRYKLDPNYKISRKKDKVGGEKTSDPIYQITLPYVLRRLGELGIPFVQMKHLEADDILSGVARYNDNVVNLVLDKDSYQYVQKTKRVFVSNAKVPYYVTPEYVMQRMGVPPELMVMYQTLVGDKGDDVPRIANFKPAKVAQICNEHRSINAFYKAADKDVRRVLKRNLERIRLNRKLVTLVDTENVKLLRMPKIPDVEQYPSAVSRYQDFLYKQRSLF